MQRSQRCPRPVRRELSVPHPPLRPDPPRPVHPHLTRCRVRADADQLARLTRVPGLFWVLVFCLLTAGAAVPPIAAQLAPPSRLAVRPGSGAGLVVAVASDEAGRIASAPPDAIIVAPATAHLLARLAQGMADDVLTAVLLARRAARR